MPGMPNERYALHGFAETVGLRAERVFRHHVTGKRNAVLVAPGTALVGKRFGKAFTHMVVI